MLGFMWSVGRFGLFPLGFVLILCVAFAVIGYVCGPSGFGFVWLFG